LYNVSGGELSTDVTTLETRLGHVFRIASRWKAIILLDEADVLMSKRSTQEIDRNAIVAGE
jgi:SpoVK/Ycf46/Vps4 family AAA+-type ATPase